MWISQETRLDLHLHGHRICGLYHIVYLELLSGGAEWYVLVVFLSSYPIISLGARSP